MYSFRVHGKNKALCRYCSTLNTRMFALYIHIERKMFLNFKTGCFLVINVNDDDLSFVPIVY